MLVGAKEGGRELFDDPSYVNVDKPRHPVAANGNAHRDAFDMSKYCNRSTHGVLGISYQEVDGCLNTLNSVRRQKFWKR